MKHDLASTHHPVLYDEAAPDPVAWSLLYPYNLESRLLRPLPNRPAFLGLGRPSADLAVIDKAGHFRLASIVGVPARPGPVAGCGWLLGQRTTTVPLAGRLPSGSWVVRIGYLASAAATTRITAGDTTATAHFQRGLGAVWIGVKGVVTSIRIDGLPAGVTVCTSDTTAGLPVAVPATSVP